MMSVVQRKLETNQGGGGGKHGVGKEKETLTKK